MKVTFLIPPSIEKRAAERLFGCNWGVYFQPCIFILYSAAILEKYGHKVNFLDCPIEKINKKQFEKFIANDDSDAYVFYTVFLAEPTDLFWAREIREHNKNVLIVFMGPEPTNRPDAFLLGNNTVVIRGEAEETIKELFEKNQSLKDIKGLSWINEEGKHIYNPSRPINQNLDKLPFPSRHLLKNPERYFNPKLLGRPSTVMLTSRGCYGRCVFCIPCSYSFAREIEYKRYHNKQKPIGGLRSPENIAKEFKLVKKQGYKSVAIIDDLFVWGEERTIKICNLIKSLKMEFGILARANEIRSQRLANALAGAGCNYVDIGVETLDERVLKWIKKDITIGDVLQAIYFLKNAGIIPKINLLLGVSPYETEEMIKNTVNRLIDMDLDIVTFGVTLPHPGTEFYQICKKNKWFVTKTKDYEPADPLEEGIVSYPNGLSNKDYARLVRWCYRRFYIRPSFIWKRLKKIRSLRRFKEELIVFLNIMR